MIEAVDLFCGAGGTSTGLVRAARGLHLELHLLAINHWAVAVETHRRNHPWAQHLCADLGSVDPNKAIPGGRLTLLVASPECTHHSVARGGRPCSDQSRASAWHVLHWAERLRIENILIENVKEFLTWGPLTKRGHPMKRRKGETFRAFLQALDSLGYRVDYRVLNAADYGDATTRHRLFIQATRGRDPRWPDATFARDADAGHARWRAAREIIDWDLHGRSIFGRKKPLSERTMKRIEAGLRKFGGAAFLTIARGPEDEPDRFARSLDEPMPVCCAGGKHLGLAEPFLVSCSHGDDRSAGRRPRSVDEPLPTVTTAHRGEMALVEPVLVAFHGKREGQAERVHSIDDPLPTVDTSNRFGIAEPFVVKYCSTGGARSVEAPLDALTTKPRYGLVEPFVLGQQSRSAPRSTDEPLPTVSTHGAIALVEPVILGRRETRMDIRFRMLQPHELAAAMGFEGYEFTGNKGDQVKQIGNAVPVNMAEALCRTILSA